MKWVEAERSLGRRSVSKSGPSSNLFKLALGIGLLIGMSAATPNARAQCPLIDPGRPSLGIEFEKSEDVEVDAKVKPGVILRLRNNTTCDVNIVTVSVEAYKPLPPKPTIMQIIKRQIEPQLPDDALIRSLYFRFDGPDGKDAVPMGCMSFNFVLMAGRSFRFGVHLEHFRAKKFYGHIEVPFTYVWEGQSASWGTNSNGPNHSVTFANHSLPESVLDRIP